MRTFYPLVDAGSSTIARTIWSQIRNSNGSRCDSRQGFVAVTHEDVVVHQPGFLPYGDTYRGRDTFVGLFDTFARYYDLTRIRCDHLVTDGERAFGVMRVPVLANGQDVLFAEQVVVRDGLVVELRIFCTRPRP